MEKRENRTVLEVAQELDYLVRARYPFICVQTYEEARVLSVVQKIAKTGQKELYVWNHHRGLWKINDYGDEETSGRDWDKMTKPGQILTYIASQEAKAVFVLQDFQAFIGKNPMIDRQIKDVVTDLQHTKKTIIVTGTYIQVPNDLDKYITLLDFPLPDKSVLDNALTDMVDEMAKMAKPIQIDLEDDGKTNLVEASRGLTVAEARHAFAKAVVENGKLDEAAVKIVTNEKRQIVRKSGILEFYPSDEDMGDIGGLDELKKYIAERSHWWSDEAKDFGLSYLKGIVLIGLPGVGKSLTAKTMASHWGLPLIRLDMGRVFDKFVGGSEENIRKAMQTAEAVAPCCLWVNSEPR